MSQKEKETEELDELEGLADDPSDTHVLDLDDDADNGVPKADEPEATPEPKTEQKAKPEYDKTQQMLDQERANARKAREQAEKLEQAQTTLTKQWESAQKELTELKEAIAVKKEERKKLDPASVTSEELVGEIETLHSQIAEQKRINAQIKGDLEKAEQQRQESAKRDAQLDTQEKILSKVEKTLGKTLGGTWEQYRVDAIKRADKLVADGEVARPKTFDDGEDLMLDCYKAIADEAKSKDSKRTSVRSDNGRSGVSPRVNEIKPGSLFSVRDQLAKKPSLWRR